MCPYDLFHKFRTWKVNIMENASSKKSVRQLFLRIGCDDHDRSVLRLHGALRLMNIKLHLIPTDRLREELPFVGVVVKKDEDLETLKHRVD